MAGYKAPIITLRFPELADDIHVVIRNPRLIPMAELRSMYAGVMTDEDKAAIEEARAAAEAGREVPDGLVTDELTSRGFTMVAGLIIGWRVWDPTVPVRVDGDGNLVEDDETVPQLLPMPATPELVGKLPAEILTRIMDEVNQVNPQARTAPQEAGTSRTS